MYRFVLIFTLALMCVWGKTDAEIEADIRARLGRSKIAVNGFQIKVRNGTAIWTGKAGVVQHKGAATRMAKAAGAKAVDNRIEISAAAKAKASESLRRTNRTAPRTEVTRNYVSRPEESKEQPKPDENAFVPPPVRRAVIKKSTP